MRFDPRLLAVLLIACTACEEDEVPSETAPERETADPGDSREAEEPEERAQPMAEPPVADESFQPPCLAVATTERGDAVIPPQLAELAGEPHTDSTLVRVFALEGRVPPTATGHQPRGHLFRWTLREAIGEPRQRFHNDEYRARLGVIAGGIPIQEGFENRQIRTLEVRLRTSGPVEHVLTVLNSKAEERPSTASQSCVDHGPLPDLTLAHFARWGWLPPALTPLAERLPDARVVRLSSDPVSVDLRADPSVNEGVASVDGLVPTDEDEVVRVEVDSPDAPN